MLCSAWDLVEADCRKALELDNSSTKVSIDLATWTGDEGVELRIPSMARLLRLGFPF